MCVCVCVCMYVCMYIYIYIYICRAFLFLSMIDVMDTFHIGSLRMLGI